MLKRVKSKTKSKEISHSSIVGKVILTRGKGGLSPLFLFGFVLTVIPFMMKDALF